MNNEITDNSIMNNNPAKEERANPAYGVAIVLAAGSGKRMHSDVAKQFLELKGKPILCYSLDAFEKSPEIDEIILVAAADSIEYCKTQIVEKYQYSKVTHIVEGGKERYHSVWNALKAACENAVNVICGNVYIHDGARPFVSEEIIKRNSVALLEDQACVTSVPSKDTIKIADEDGYVSTTPKRSLVRNIQTPQSFYFPVIFNAFDKLIRDEEKILGDGIQITDDAMVVELFEQIKVRLVEGSYDNIKITTPDDLILAEKIYECQ